MQYVYLYLHVRFIKKVLSSDLLRNVCDILVLCIDPATTNCNFTAFIHYIPASTKLKGGILVSLCPSLCPYVRMWTESCPHSIFNNTRQIYFIFTHLIKQHLKVCLIWSFSKLKNLKFWQILYICNWLCLVLTPIWINSMGVIMGQWRVSTECRHFSCSSYHKVSQFKCTAFTKAQSPITEVYFNISRT